MLDVSTAVQRALAESVRTVAVGGKLWYAAVDACALLGGRLGGEGASEYGKSTYERLQDQIPVRLCGVSYQERADLCARCRRRARPPGA